MKKTIRLCYLLNAFAFLISTLLQGFNYNESLTQQNMSKSEIFIHLIPIVVAKGTHEILWTILYTYVNEILPSFMH